MENNNSVKPSGINESFLEELNGTVQGEVKQEETKAFDQPGNGGSMSLADSKCHSMI